ncbi:unnamed protein product (macronuclear) [Paramecium tetraurelia]|uniref:Uncharacterized protein n=1 Tax=Paramecium tetraurelia TaxID=5888 RepID=A0BS86_PARTE|nr:uncharacterized protein GSPATT00031634001 [Paramecium tetraurelia]CAK61403.1 unnamed protein product [Paramecium tetraurelia]|eukprot:XP_001428801.1 hypothetical protein (macronuclear) [Paramecium tetraurelia strain d4-2]
MLQQEKINLREEKRKKVRHDKFKRKVQFLQLVLCQNQTIKDAAAISKVNFSTAKLVLKNFRQFGYIKNTDKGMFFMFMKDYGEQLELLKQISSIKSEIKQEKIEKREKEFRILSDKIKSIQPAFRKKQFQSEKEINSKLEHCQQELENLKKIQFVLVTSVLQEQIKLMKSSHRCI